MSFFIHDLHLDYACTRLAPMRQPQLVPMHILSRWVLARLAVGENLTSRGGGGTNQQCSGGVVPMHQPNGNPACYPTTVGADEPHRILEAGKLRESESEMLGTANRSEKAGSTVRDTHGHGDNPSQSPPIWADRYTQPHWNRRVGVDSFVGSPESEAVGSTTKRQPVDGL